MPQPADRLYTKEHEWVKFEARSATIGITDYAQSSLGDIVYVEMPKPGARVERAKAMGVVESVKAVSDIYAPVSGTVSEVNPAVDADPATVNGDPYGLGWLVKVTVDERQPDGLLAAEAYDELLSAQAH
ncbi:MAG: glycine cleavage system protein GcvH [Candidatus Eremiobacteraeota bacterium]|nr:glycine cleavage system protein GcvH [Candidatus Eremiobacteraeota bacterium]